MRIVDALGTTLKRLGECGDASGVEPLAGVLHGEHYAGRVIAGGDPDGSPSVRLWTIALCTRLVVICNSSACDPVVKAASPDVSMETPRAFCDGEKHLRGLFGCQGQVDELVGEGALVGATEQEQGFGEFDGSVVDGAEAVDELIGVAVRVLAGDI